MVFKPLSTTAFLGTATVVMDGYLFGGCAINSDGTNAAVVTVREDDAAGKILFYISAKASQLIKAPILSASKTLHLTVSGTGASAFFYEAIP